MLFDYLLFIILYWFYVTLLLIPELLTFSHISILQVCWNIINLANLLAEFWQIVSIYFHNSEFKNYNNICPVYLQVSTKQLYLNSFVSSCQIWIMTQITWKIKISNMLHKTNHGILFFTLNRFKMGSSLTYQDLKAVPGFEDKLVGSMNHIINGGGGWIGEHDNMPACCSDGILPFMFQIWILMAIQILH